MVSVVVEKRMGVGNKANEARLNLKYMSHECMSMIANDRLHGYHWWHWYAVMRLQALTPQAPTSPHLLNRLRRTILRQGNTVTSKPLLSQKPNEV